MRARPSLTVPVYLLTEWPMSYPYEQRDFFEPAYPQSIHCYDFYPPPAPDEPVVPYGWRADWSRPTASAWPGYPLPIDTTQHAIQSLPTVAVPASVSLAAPAPLFPDQDLTLSQPINNHLHVNVAQPALFLPTDPKLDFSVPLAKLPSGGSRLHSSQLKQARSNSHRPFSCHICGKSFSQAANLTAHRRVHTGEKPFTCSICNRPFSQSSSLVTHKRTHTGERPYPCNQCEKSFTDSSTLTKHLRTHSGQKPYGCEVCHMRFTQSGNLHRHMKTHKMV